MRELLSFSEFGQPWRLYLLPGLMAAQLSHIFWIGFLTRLVRHLTAPTLGGLPPSTPASPGDDTYTGPSSEVGVPSTFGLALFLAWCVLSVVVLSPLECVIVRLSVQRPERQQPLHLAYARTASAQASGPAPYNNQAQVSQATAPPTSAVQGSYSDEAPASAPATEPTDPAPRPSFAIEDDEEESQEYDKGTATTGDLGAEAEAPKQNSAPNGNATNSSAHPTAHRVLGLTQSGAQTTPNAEWLGAENEPSEPVIALRPCDEPLSAEEAARAEAEGFGAPTVERYQGMADCLNKLVDEEGIEALYRGAWVTLLGVMAGNFS